MRFGPKLPPYSLKSETQMNKERRSLDSFFIISMLPLIYILLVVPLIFTGIADKFENLIFGLWIILLIVAIPCIIIFFFHMMAVERNLGIKTYFGWKSVPLFIAIIFYFTSYRKFLLGNKTLGEISNEE